MNFKAPGFSFDSCSEVNAQIKRVKVNAEIKKNDNFSSYADC